MDQTFVFAASNRRRSRIIDNGCKARGCRSHGENFRHASPGKLPLAALALVLLVVSNATTRSQVLDGAAGRESVGVQRDETGGTSCWSPGEPPLGPDLIVGNIDSVGNFLAEDGVEAFSLGESVCNIGGQNASWQHQTSQHPVAGQNMFRLRDGRFEQIGQAWVFHEFVALAQNLCGCGCNGEGGAVLGAGCSNPHPASYLGFQEVLGPKSEINAFTGTFTFPPSNPEFSGTVARRLQVSTSDLDPTASGGGLYFVEVQYVAAEDSTAGRRDNNASYRPIVLSGSGNAWNASLTGTTQREMAGIRAWQDNDPAVVETDVSVPGEGLFILAAKATDMGDGVWHYEYALQNLSSHRSAGSFAVPLPACAVVQNAEFHDVDYHSGEPYDGTDWPAAVATESIQWSTVSYDVNPEANALRWGTLYNFRFATNVPPGTGDVGIGLFRPGVPSTVMARSVVPLAAMYGDIFPDGGNGTIDIDDLFCVLAAFLDSEECPAADLMPCGGNGLIDVDDVLAELDAFTGIFACPNPCLP